MRELNRLTAPDVPHWFLGTLGVEPSRQREGIGAALLAPVLRLCDEDHVPAALRVCAGPSVRFHERLGFAIHRSRQVPAGGPTIHLMWRDPET